MRRPAALALHRLEPREVPVVGLAPLALGRPAAVAGVTAPHVFTHSEQTTTTLAVSNMAPQLGETVALTATARTTVGGQPAVGEVVFRDGTVELGRATTSASGVATLPDVRLRLGPRAITAAFTPAPTTELLASTSPTVRLTVAKADSSAELTITPTTSVVGSPITFEARVRTKTGIPAIGTVLFHDNDTLLATATVNGNGVARVTLTNLPVGFHWVAARYVGSSTVNRAESAPLLVTVRGVGPIAPTTIQITTARPSYRLGEQVYVTFKVTKGAGEVPEPSGYLRISLNGRNVGDGTLAPDGSSFSFITARPLGSMRLRAEHYDTNLNLTGSSELVVPVGKSNTSVAFVNPPVVPTPASTPPRTLQMKVTPEFEVGMPIGGVTLRVNGTALGTFAVNGNGIANVVFPQGYFRGLGVVRLEYSGSSVFNPSTFEVTV